jgi:hypothetical protein
MPNITVVSGAEAQVGVERQGAVVRAYYSCFYTSSPSECPRATYIVELLNGTVLYNQTYAVDPAEDCRGPNICRYMVEARVPDEYSDDRLRFSYILWYNGTRVEKSIELPPPAPGWAGLAAMLPVIVAAGFALQYSLRAAAVGLIAGTAVSYMLAAAGLLPHNPLVYYLSILFAAAILVLTRE